MDLKGMTRKQIIEATREAIDACYEKEFTSIRKLLETIDVDIWGDEIVRRFEKKLTDAREEH